MTLFCSRTIEPDWPNWLPSMSLETAFPFAPLESVRSGLLACEMVSWFGPLGIASTPPFCVKSLVRTSCAFAEVAAAAEPQRAMSRAVRLVDRVVRLAVLVLVVVCVLVFMVAVLPLHPVRRDGSPGEPPAYAEGAPLEDRGEDRPGWVTGIPMFCVVV